MAIGVACGLIGLGVGRVSAREDQAPPAVRTTTLQQQRPAALQPKGMLCARRTAELEEAGCAKERLRAQWCEGQLSQCEASQSANRHAWPEDDDSIEGPQAWANAVEEALDDCEIESAEIETIECSEYPCVAALRPAVVGEPDDPEFAKAQERLIEGLRGCAPLREAFGIDDATTKALDVFSNDTTCPDGSRRDFFALMALDPSGPAYALIEEDRKRSKREERDLFRWLFRRGDDIAAAYPCEP